MMTLARHRVRLVRATRWATCIQRRGTLDGIGDRTAGYSAGPMMSQPYLLASSATCPMS